MKKKKIVVMRSYIVSLSCLYLMICSSCGNPRSGESKNEDNTKEIEIVKKEPITYNFYVENSGSVKGFFKGNTNDAGNILKEFYDRIEENKGDDDTISLNYINNEISSQKITINKWLNQIYVNCNSRFSDIDKVLEQILLTTNDNTINILLSDYCFESRFGNLDKAKSEITKIFTKGINKYNDLSIAIYKYEASFDGFHFPGRLPGGHGAGPHRPGHPPENDHHRPAAGGQQPPAPQHRRRCASQSGGAVLNTEYLNDRKTGAENAPVFSVFPGKSLYLQYRFC